MAPLVRIEPAPPGGEGVRVIVEQKDGTTTIMKALAVEITLDTTPPRPDHATPEAGP